MTYCRKYIISLIAILLIGITNSYSQRNIESAKTGAQRMRELFYLNQEQAVKLEALNENYAKKLNAINASSDSIRVKGERKKELFQQKEAELKVLFTAEQYSKYQAFKVANRRSLKETIPQKKTN